MTLLLVELEKLRTIRSAWLLFAAGVLMPLPIVIAMLIGTSDYGPVAQNVIDLAVLPAAIAGVLAVTACAREFEHRTITVALMTEPRRERVIVAKAGAAAIVSLAMATLFCALCLGVAAVWISSAGGVWPWTGHQTLEGAGGTIALTALIAVAGTGFGALVRHVGGAITLMAVMYLVVEGVLVARVPAYHDWGLTAAANSVIEPTLPHTYAFSAGMAILLGSSLAYLALGIAAVRRADV
ncbi:ABC transporter permease [Conexibacter sp. JD483]|uniref:ABC transporter permease n=1 Tax=unclassified Conexibacter TaxID=2627773 RepID=UPI00271C9FD5|nr:MULTISPECIES: ABC transporter permease [unclassified Conexibacter]MDO8186585.1 ABC transporter permease [Conexibacter sp. CPCC 205706]MDO8196690.1 ABC transporter permease [Conexibacter sp. CPCC 205762]MDR9372656.1 ABC transporter permease [Conexibacter sp. JD483]